MKRATASAIFSSTQTTSSSVDFVQASLRHFCRMISTMWWEKLLTLNFLKAQKQFLDTKFLGTREVY